MWVRNCSSPQKIVVIMMNFSKNNSWIIRDWMMVLVLQLHQLVVVIITHQNMIDCERGYDEQMLWTKKNGITDNNTMLIDEYDMVCDRVWKYYLPTMLCDGLQHLFEISMKKYYVNLWICHKFMPLDKLTIFLECQRIAKLEICNPIRLTCF